MALNNKIKLKLNFTIIMDESDNIITVAFNLKLKRKLGQSGRDVYGLEEITSVKEKYDTLYTRCTENPNMLDISFVYKNKENKRLYQCDFPCLMSGKDSMHIPRHTDKVIDAIAIMDEADIDNMVSTMSISDNTESSYDILTEDKDDILYMQNRTQNADESDTDSYFDVSADPIKYEQHDNTTNVHEDSGDNSNSRVVQSDIFTGKGDDLIIIPANRLLLSRGAVEDSVAIDNWVGNGDISCRPTKYSHTIQFESEEQAKEFDELPESERTMAISTYKMPYTNFIRNTVQDTTSTLVEFKGPFLQFDCNGTIMLHDTETEAETETETETGDADMYVSTDDIKKFLNEELEFIIDRKSIDDKHILFRIRKVE